MLLFFHRRNAAPKMLTVALVDAHQVAIGWRGYVAMKPHHIDPALGREPRICRERFLQYEGGIVDRPKTELECRSVKAKSLAIPGASHKTMFARKLFVQPAQVKQGIGSKFVGRGLESPAVFRLGRRNRLHQRRGRAWMPSII